jgi:hypothetical protein
MLRHAFPGHARFGPSADCTINGQCEWAKVVWL